MGKQKKQITSVKSTKQLKLAFLALGILILFIILAKVVSFLIGLNQPISGDLKTEREYSWDGKTSFNIAIVTAKEDSSEISVLNYHPSLEKAVVLHIPDKTYLDLPKGYGLWKVGSIYKLGQEESKPVGAQLLKLSLSKLLGLPIDGIIIDQSKELKNTESLINEWRKNSLYMASFIYSSKTDLTPIEAFRLLGVVTKVREDKFVSLDFERSSVTESKLLPDSSRVLGIDNVKLDTFIRENMSDTSIIDEGSSIAIYNATSRPGLAQDVARVITNLGGDVVTIQTSEKLSAVTLVTTAPDFDKENSLTYKRVTEVYAPRCLEKECATDDRKVTSSRAQINIILGEDYYQTWYKR